MALSLELSLIESQLCWMDGWMGIEISVKSLLKAHKMMMLMITIKTMMLTMIIKIIKMMMAIVKMILFLMMT